MHDAKKISGERAQWVIDDRTFWMLNELRHNTGVQIAPEYDSKTSKVTIPPPAVVQFTPVVVRRNEDGSVDVEASVIVTYANIEDCEVGGFAQLKNPPPNSNTVYLHPRYEGEPGSMKVLLRRFVAKVITDGTERYVVWERVD
jgi:hypothetical protein